MRKYILSIVSVVIAISLLWIYFTKDDNNKTPEATLDSSPSYAEKTPKHEPLIVSRDQPLYINYHNCKNTLRKYQDSREVWRRESGSYISNYTDDYSSNTILYALTLLDSSEFAYRKRGVTLSEGKNKIRRESKTSNIFQKLGLFENKKRGIEFRLNLSVEKLEKLFELSQDKRQETFNDFGLLVVEV
ncbi:MAG: hypothetical protein L3J46_10895, partial [Kangiellaceae bacterium]|nr:hypothetical protein [Kangiellaceae bacterium]